jgi:hypothetical protein
MMNPARIRKTELEAKPERAPVTVAIPRRGWRTPPSMAATGRGTSSVTQSITTSTKMVMALHPIRLNPGGVGHPSMRMNIKIMGSQRWDFLKAGFFW